MIVHNMWYWFRIARTRATHVPRAKNALHLAVVTLHESQYRLHNAFAVMFSRPVV